MKKDKDYENLGVQIAALLNLEIKENGRVDTAFGDKTMIGLGKTFERMLDEFKNTQNCNYYDNTTRYII